MRGGGGEEARSVRSCPEGQMASGRGTFFLIHPAAFTQGPLVHKPPFQSAGDWCAQ